MMSEIRSYIGDKEVEPIEGLEILEWVGTRVVVRYENKVRELDVKPSNENPKSFEVFFGGRRHMVDIKDRTDLLLEEMGLDTSVDMTTSDLNAPMPGLVIDVLVASNDVVEKGSPMLVLEAMKMENMIKAEGDAEIQDVLVKSGETVEKGQPMIIFKK